MVKRAGCPGRGRRVTAIALGSRRDVCSRLCLGVLGDESTAMTTDALARHAGVIHRRWRPVDETADMACIALSCRRDVGCRFGQGIGENKGAIVAIGTLSDGTNVVHQGRLERCRIVTVAALCGCWDMCTGLAECARACMAGCTLRKR